MTESDSSRQWWKRTVGQRASGIFSRRTGFLPVEEALRRRRSKLARPPLELSLALLLCAVAFGAAATLHRRNLDARFSASVVRSQAAPFEIQKIRRDLSGSEVDEATLEKELEARLAAVDAQASSEFYLILDTRAGKMTFRYGDRIVREAPLTVGASRPISSASGEKIRAPRLSGAFTVRQKLEKPAWKPPPFVWQAAGLPVPKPLPEIAGSLGRYVVVLTDDVVLHSPPPPDSPLKGARPGSFMAPEADLAAIWKRLSNETRVYVF
jgi:hypothetical protein